MSISGTYTPLVYVGDGGTTAFPYDFLILTDADIVVTETIIATGVETVKTLTTHYTVTGEGTGSGTVTAVTAPAGTVRWTIGRLIPRTQLMDLVENDSLPAETLETAFDKVTMIAQEQDSIFTRTIRQPDGDEDDVDALPPKVDRASKYLAFDADGNPTATAGTENAFVVSAFAETVLDDGTAGAARTTLGAVGLTGNETVAGVKTFSSIPVLTGGAITFPATQVPSANANTLDDYEEGVWTPVVGGSATYTTQNGTYTKVGRLVTIRCYLTINAIGTGSTINITGIPFAPPAGTGIATAAVYWTAAANSVVTVVAVLLDGTSTITLNSATAAATGITSGTGIMGNSTSIRFSLTYETT